MFSMGVVVSLMFFGSVALGLASVIFRATGMKLFALEFGFLAFASGVCWCVLAPSPFSLVGGAVAVLGAWSMGAR